MTKIQDGGAYNPDFTFQDFLRKWFGLKGEYWTDEYKLFMAWYENHGKDPYAEDTLPDGLTADRLEWICDGWWYDFEGMGVTPEAHEAWSRAQAIVEDLVRVGVISDEQALLIQYNYCDIALA